MRTAAVSTRPPPCSAAPPFYEPVHIPGPTSYADREGTYAPTRSGHAHGSRVPYPPPVGLDGWQFCASRKGVAAITAAPPTYQPAARSAPIAARRLAPEVAMSSTTSAGRPWPGAALSAPRRLAARADRTESGRVRHVPTHGEYRRRGEPAGADPHRRVSRTRWSPSRSRTARRRDGTGTSTGRPRTARLLNRLGQQLCQRRGEVTAPPFFVVQQSHAAPRRRRARGLRPAHRRGRGASSARSAGREGTRCSPPCRTPRTIAAARGRAAPRRTHPSAAHHAATVPSRAPGGEWAGPGCGQRYST